MDVTFMVCVTFRWCSVHIVSRILCILSQPYRWLSGRLQWLHCSDDVHHYHSLCLATNMTLLIKLNRLRPREIRMLTLTTPARRQAGWLLIGPTENNPREFKLFYWRIFFRNVVCIMLSISRPQCGNAMCKEVTNYGSRCPDCQFIIIGGVHHWRRHLEVWCAIVLA